MTTTTERATLPEAPAQDWSNEDFGEFFLAAGAAGSVAWGVLTHSIDNAADFTRVLASPPPEGLESEDMLAWTWEIVTTAASIGYWVGKIDVAAFEDRTPGRDGKVKIVDMARAVASLARMPLVEDRADR